ncbi:MAG: bifunctional folylpolyglutamate synthase/dihydrofolate synthase, partial [Planctomycetales bacterium]|nr:bifunctional folylpolyglutamate synthase/dihydrofolate synthase [Planctomycetales bacterium]
LRRLGNPQESMPIVHVAGTKGKGSTAAMIAAIFTAAGYRAGLFTSPHLDRVEERMAVDARPCPPEEYAELVELVRPEVEAMDRAAARCDPPEHGPTYFEIITATALKHFAIRKVEAAVLEVGLGGRLDSTNVCSPCLSIITSISFDHTRQLGETLESIAAEKAGIIKPGTTVISGVRAERPREVIGRAAAAAGCRLVQLGVDFDFEYHPPRHLEKAPSPARFDFHLAPGHLAPGHLAPGEYTGGSSYTGGPASTDGRLVDYPNIPLAMLGRHQAANAAVALAGVEELRLSGWTIPETAIRRGLAEVVWPARVEVLARRPAVVLDAAHNVASIEALVEALEESFSVARRLLVFAATQDKDVGGMWRALLGRFDHAILTRYLNNPRGVPPEELRKLAACWCGSSTDCWCGSSTAAPTVEIAPTPADAWDAVGRLAQPDDLICVTGSFFLAAEMRRLIAERPLSPRP